MRWVGYQHVPIKRIHLPGDIAARQRQQHVVELAASVDELGGDPMHAPVVDGETWGLVAGRDRMAAMLLRGAKKVWVHVGVDFTARELLRAEVLENLRRRNDDRDALLARLVDATEAELPLTVSNNSTGPGRPKTPRTIAREQVARDAGVTVQAVRMAEQRRDAQLSPAASNNSPPPCPIETWGRPIHPADLVAVTAQHDDIEAADRALHAAMQAVRRVGGHPGLSVQMSDAYAALRDMAGALRAKKYAAVCPYCAEAVGVAENCSACKGLRLLRADQVANLPSEVTGQPEPLFSGPVEPEPRRSSAPRKLRTEDADGNPLNVDLQGDPEPDIAAGDVSDEEIPF